MSRILLVDPDTRTRVRTMALLTQAGYECHGVSNGTLAIAYLSQQRVDLVLSELDLPLLQGRTFIQRASQRFAMPIIALVPCSARDQRIQAYHFGADVCLEKTNDHDELLACVYAILRRVSIEQQRKHLISEDDQFNLRLKRLPLTSTETELLNYLFNRSGKAVSKLELQQRVLQREYSPFDRNLDVHISNIRKKMVKTGINAALIKTVRGVGYCFEVPL